MKKALLACCLLVNAGLIQAQKYFLFTGTYTTGKSEGIYVYSFDAANGEIKPVDTSRGVLQPSYLALSGDGKFLYAVNETGGKEPGSISAFSFDAASGKLKFLNKKPSKGDYPCYVSVSPNGKWVVAGNYGGGNLVAYAIQPDGSLSDNFQVIQHEGKGGNPARQEKPHVHATVFSPDKKFLLVPDLGTDKVMIYHFNEHAAQNPIRKSSQGFAQLPPASGPRHLDFHPNGKWMYLVEELSGKISVWNYHRGKLSFRQRVNGHPQGYSGDYGSADIHVSDDGRYLYASHRFQANNLSIHSINPKDGSLTESGFQDVMGRKPRNFMVVPGGKFVLVANQETDDFRVFSRNAADGRLQPTGTVVSVGSPVCLKLLQVAR